MSAMMHVCASVTICTLVEGKAAGEATSTGQLAAWRGLAGQGGKQPSSASMLSSPHPTLRLTMSSLLRLACRHARPSSSRNSRGTLLANCARKVVGGRERAGAGAG